MNLLYFWGKGQAVIIIICRIIIIVVGTWWSRYTNDTEYPLLTALTLEKCKKLEKNAEQMILIYSAQGCSSSLRKINRRPNTIT